MEPHDLTTEIAKHPKLIDLCRHFGNRDEYLATAQRLLAAGMTEPTYARLRMPRRTTTQRLLAAGMTEPTYAHLRKPRRTGDIVTPWMGIADTFFMAQKETNLKDSMEREIIEYGSPATLEHLHFWVFNGDLKIRDSNVNIIRWVREFPIAHHTVDVIRNTFQWYENQGSIVFTLETIMKVKKLDDGACFDWLLEHKNKAVATEPPTPLNPCRFCGEVPTVAPSDTSITCCNHTSPKDRWNGHNPLFNPSPSITFGEYIKQARVKQGLQQQEVAKELGISAQYMNDLERDRRNPPDDDKMHALARVLNLDSDLLYWHAQRWPPDIQAKAHTIDDLDTIRAAFQSMRGALRIF